MEEFPKVLKQLNDFLDSVKPGVGPSPKFRASHAIMCLFIIAEKQPIGRKKLSTELGIGEGSARSLLARLKSLELLNISKKGLMLNEKGEEFLKRLNLLMSPPKRVSAERIAISRVSTAILVRGVAEKVGNGMRVRDAAVSHGASGATTLIFMGGKLQIPGVSQDAATDFPEEVRSLVEELKPREGDAIILGTAERWRDAELGAIAGALSLLGVDW